MNSFLNNGITAHRGNSSEWPENTLAAFMSAIDIGADWIELDVRKTKDGSLVVIHDDNTQRTSDVNLHISASTYSELKKADMAFQFRKDKKLSDGKCPRMSIPLLSEVLDLIKTQNKTRISIQPKVNAVAEIINLAKKMNAIDWIGFNDGNLEMMCKVKQSNRQIPVFWDTSLDIDIEAIVSTAKAHHFETVVMYESTVDENKIEMLHKAGIAAGAWTVNSPETMKKFFGMGIDRLYTDYPTICMKIKGLSS